MTFEDPGNVLVADTLADTVVTKTTKSGNMVYARLNVTWIHQFELP